MLLATPRKYRGVGATSGFTLEVCRDRIQLPFVEVTALIGALALMNSVSTDAGTRFRSAAADHVGSLAFSSSRS
jgi:hypothetical protein